MSFGTDNKFKIWRKFERKARDAVSSEKNPRDFLNYFWNCEFEGEYKKLPISNIIHTYSKKKSADLLLLSVENLLVCWVNFISIRRLLKNYQHFFFFFLQNIDSLNLEFAINVVEGDLKSAVPFECNGEETVALLGSNEVFN